MSFLRIAKLREMAALLVEAKHFNLGAGNMIDFADFLDSTM